MCQCQGFVWWSHAPDIPGFVMGERKGRMGDCIVISSWRTGAGAGDRLYARVQCVYTYIRGISRGTLPDHAKVPLTICCLAGHVDVQSAFIHLSSIHVPPLQRQSVPFPVVSAHRTR